MSDAARQLLASLYRTQRRPVLATLIRLLGGFDAAEDALQEAFAAAAVQWPRDGVPDNPTAWLISAGRFRTIDRWRRETRLALVMPELAALADESEEIMTPATIADDDLRLIFICCHPALKPDARIALTLREVGGLTTEEIARAYLTTAPTIAQRIVRAKAKIRHDGLRYELPERSELPGRLESVLRVIYLIFNEGYVATHGPDLTRADLCTEAIRLGRLVVDLIDDSEAVGLLALMLLHDARRLTRTDANGDLVLLEHQDRGRWDHRAISEAQDMLDQALASRRVGPYILQAAIASVHAGAPSYAQINWAEIVALYDVLRRIDPSPVVSLNRAAAISMRDGPEAGLAALGEATATGSLASYHLAHAARADMLRRLGRIDEARASYREALALATQQAERRFLQGRVDALGQS